jgi:SAM-dependent methyltransferase
VTVARPLTCLRVSRPVNLLRYHAYRDVLLAYPRRHTCNLCGWRGRRFLKFGHEGVLCPRCGSVVRHRMVAAALEGCRDIRDLVRLDRAAVLHFSPEYCLRRFFQPRAREYVSADYSTANADLRLDLTNMREIATGRFDTLVACDVLEHIIDEGAALGEIRRVLRPGGTAILAVPQQDGDAPTYEDSTKTSFAEREAAFGQGDHVRLYGSDFCRRLEAAGFSVVTVDAARFDPLVVREHVLVPRPRQTAFGDNWRRIYFASA